MEYLNTGNVSTVHSRRTAKAPAAAPSPYNVTMITNRSRPFVEPVVSAPVITTAQPVKPAIELVMYSERSFAIFGETRPLQAQLEALGGKFNRWLKRDGVATPGYIFSIGRIDNVRKTLGL